MSEPDEDEVRTYFVRCQDGDFMLEIPSSYKLTFGAVNPSSQTHSHDLHCLRIYDGPNAKNAALRAVFCNVSGFRDLSMPLARKTTKETGSAEWSRDDGSEIVTRKRELEHSYTTDDPDDIPF
jgi:hypothetical protein